MNTKAGRVKDLNMKRDPRISICVEDGYSYVTVSGIVEMDEAPFFTWRPNNSH